MFLHPLHLSDTLVQNNQNCQTTKNKTADIQTFKRAIAKNSIVYKNYVRSWFSDSLITTKLRHLSISIPKQWIYDGIILHEF